jgi:hypothetical protein
VSEGPDAVVAVIEIKLVRNDDKVKSCLAELKSQLLNASVLFPGADIVGIVFLATAPYLTPGTLAAASEQLRNGIEGTFPEREGFRSVPGFELRPIFHLVPTSFTFPQMNVSLSLAIMHLRS